MRWERIKHDEAQNFRGLCHFEPLPVRLLFNFLTGKYSFGRKPGPDFVPAESNPSKVPEIEPRSNYHFFCVGRSMTFLFHENLLGGCFTVVMN